MTKTSIVISHRLGIARFCNKIIVMKDGEIVEMGDHDQLINKGGEYAYLYHAQSAWYNSIADYKDLTECYKEKIV